jgi:hypothetical protein
VRFDSGSSLQENTNPEERTLPLPPQNSQNGNVRDESGEFAQRMYALHPKKKDLMHVLGSLRMAVNRGHTLIEIEACHAAHVNTPAWKEDSGRYCPSLAKWLDDDGFTAWPNGKKPQKPIDESRIVPYDPFGIQAKRKTV